MKKLDHKTVVIGIGNIGRQDDGIGWLFLDYLKELNTNIDLEYRYQLQIEDAELISRYCKVFFIDATKETTEHGFYLKPCLPLITYNFSSHAEEPETILRLCNKLYHCNPETSIFGIQGYHWDLKIGLSKKGTVNLNKAKKFFKDKVLINYL